MPATAKTKTSKAPKLSRPANATVDTPRAAQPDAITAAGSPNATTDDPSVEYVTIKVPVQTGGDNRTLRHIDSPLRTRDAMIAWRVYQASGIDRGADLGRYLLGLIAEQLDGGE